MFLTADPSARVVELSPEGRLRFADGKEQFILHFEDPAYSIFYCVRHAEKIRDGSEDPDLAPEGHARAQRLGELMAQARIDLVASTPYRRTRLTAAAVRTVLPATPPFEEVEPRQQSRWVLDLLERGPGLHLFYAGHQHTVPNLLNQLIGQYRFPNISDDDFGRLYIAVTKGIGQTEVLELEY